MRWLLLILLAIPAFSQESLLMSGKSTVPITRESSFDYYATTFDGTDYMTRGAYLTGLSDGKTGLVSFWVNMDAASSDAALYCVMGSGSSRFRVQRLSAGGIRVYAYNSSGVGILHLNDDGGRKIYSTNGWHHVAMSWNLATAGCGWLFIDGTNHTSTVIFTDDAIDYADSANFGIGAEAGGGNKLPACLSEVYFTTEYLALTNNIEKFINGGKPVDLGEDGTTPTGTQPLIYLHGDYTGFNVNSGSGGNFSITGTLTSCDAP